MNSPQPSEQSGSFGEGPPHIAAGAMPIRTSAAGAEPALKDDLLLSGPIKALLTDVVLRLRETWIAGPAKCWGGVHPICELSVANLDKRVAAALCEGFSNFSQFLCGLEVLMLQDVDGSAEFEKTLLGIEQLFVHGPNYFHRLGLVSDGQRALSEVDGAIDSGDSTTDEGEIHGTHPNVEEGWAKTPAFALPGNLCGRGQMATEVSESPAVSNTFKSESTDMSVPEINEVVVTEEGVAMLLTRVRSIQVASTDEGKLLTVTDTAFAVPVRFHLTNDAADHLSRLLISNPSEPAHA